MYWLFNSNRFESFQGNESETLTWEQYGNFSGSKGDYIVFYLFEKDQKIFTYLYKISDVSIIEIETNKETRRQRTEIIVNATLEQVYKDKEFSEYIYSFFRIKYFDKQIGRHFNRRYYRLSEPEFNAIDKDQIFLSRTILGNALNALHIEHRKAFAIDLVEQYPQVLQNVYDNDAVLNLLIEYLDFAIVNPSKQLRAGFTFLNEAVDNRFPSSEVVFDSINKNPNIVNVLSLQVAVINEYIVNLEGIKTSLEQSSNTRVERSFKQKFAGKALPIDLTK